MPRTVSSRLRRRDATPVKAPVRNTPVIVKPKRRYRPEARLRAHAPSSGFYQTEFRVDYGPGPWNPHRYPVPPLGGFGTHIFDKRSEVQTQHVDRWIDEGPLRIVKSRHGPATQGRDVTQVGCAETYSGLECYGFTAFGINGPASVRLGYPYLNWYTWENQPGKQGYRDILQGILGPIYLELLTRDFKSKFELIPTLMDLDSTIKMITDKFPSTARQTRRAPLPKVETVPPGESRDRLIQKYRDVHSEAMWGWIPFIGDVPKFRKAIEGQFRNVEKYGSESTQIPHNYSTSVSRSYLVPNRSGNWVKSIEGKVSMSGFITTSFGLGQNTAGFRQLISALDMLGVHPDAKTAWDVMPLSFVADYFLPIGDTLEKIHPRGWMTGGISFTGWLTAKLEVTCTESLIHNNVQRHSLGVSEHLFYERRFVSGITVNGFTKPSESKGWEAPSPANLFNTLVLSKAVKQKYLS